MNKKILMVFLFLTVPHLARADSQWVLTQSTLTYHVSHPLHQVEGVSHAARGKGICQAGECNILLAVPVKSFDSGESNRDLHMLQVTHGAQFPMVVVRVQLPEAKLTSGKIDVDLQIQFAGQTAHLDHVPFQLKMEANQAILSGTIPTTLSDFKIVPPSLLLMPIKNEIPVQARMTWNKQP